MKENEMFGFECHDCHQEVYGVSWASHPGINICKNQHGERYPFCPNCGEPGEFFDYRDDKDADSSNTQAHGRPTSGEGVP